MPVDIHRLKELFAAAVALPAADRAPFLDRECADTGLRKQVEALVQAHEGSGSFLAAPVPGKGELTSDCPAPEPTADFAPAGTAGAVIAGRYTLVELIGEGGMGEVWVARQNEPVKRKVALKLIKAGMDTKAVLQRFEAERQALALMDHPNIAKVLDGGMVDEPRTTGSGTDQPLTVVRGSGKPYFVMELVNGLPLNRFCDDAKLGIKERLELFVAICQAVQHAHQKGIIHRDLKPSNILVTVLDGKPVPKIIDFGVAKAIGGRLTDESLSTQFGAVVGTLEYMSPEQAGFSGADVDTRADIYSLGVILYELLTGLRPFDSQRLKQAALDEVIRIIREVEPSKPSTRLSTEESLPSLAAMRHIDPAKLTALLRSELDWVVMKCLEKQRDRRYETANGLARDIQRYLADEPVEARPPSATYRLRKFARKNRAALTTAAAIAVLLVGGITVSTWQAIRATRAEAISEKERDRAEEEKLIAKAVRDFLQNKLLALADTKMQADALLAGGRASSDAELDPRISELLKRASEALAPGKIESQFPDQPLVQAEILETIGYTYLGIGKYPEAIAHLERARDIQIAKLGPDHPHTLTTLNDLALAYQFSGKLPDAIRLFEQVRDARLTMLGPDHPDTLTTLGGLAAAYLLSGKVADAVRLFEQVRDANVALRGVDHPITLVIRYYLAEAYQLSGRLTDAVQLFEQVRDAQVARIGANHPDTLILLNSLAGAYWKSGKLPDAVRLLEHVRDVQVAKLGADHPFTLTTLHNLAGAYGASGNVVEAVRLFEQVRDARMARLGADHPSTLSALCSLASAYYAAGRLAEAVLLLEKVRDAQVGKLGADHPDMLRTLKNLAGGYRAAGRLTEAIGHYEQVRDIQVAKLGADHPDTLNTQANLAVAYQASGKLSEAVRLYEQVRDARVARLGANHPETLTSIAALGKCYRTMNRLDEAAQLLEQSSEGMERRSFQHPNAGPILGDTTECFEQMKEFEKAEGWRRKWLAHVKEKSGVQSPAYAAVLAGLGPNLINQKKHADAEAVLRESLAIREKKEPEAWTTFSTQSMLGGALLGQKKYSEAEPLLLKAYEGMKAREKTPEADAARLALQQRMVEAINRLIELYEAQDKKDEAVKWKAELEKVKPEKK